MEFCYCHKCKKKCLNYAYPKSAHKFLGLSAIKEQDVAVLVKNVVNGY